ncbi:hypothetical protein [Polaromonas naphthalenivorans]|uniref:Transmembrane protein n=1 Tax=Polaromonas naphthalenivorans (strain CJ2) TaxID=365044 RepID=A1VPG7_POLNA|nr:hypothetical protein [Polaromonas naphthalenivorans]ABM37545.1 hypothetical protein Pnap_2237 [Polaromonas naphthalenivorans CJ2]
MNKNELELRKLSIQAGNFAAGMHVFQHFITMLTIGGCLFLVMHGLQVMVASKPESLNSLALVIEKLQINEVFGYLFGCIGGLGWYGERRGKQRAYRELGKQRAATEQSDPYHSSSELDPNGLTPSK